MSSTSDDMEGQGVWNKRHTSNLLAKKEALQTFLQQ